MYHIINSFDMIVFRKKVEAYDAIRLDLICHNYLFYSKSYHFIELSLKLGSYNLKAFLLVFVDVSYLFICLRFIKVLKLVQEEYHRSIIM